MEEAVSHHVGKDVVRVQFIHARNSGFALADTQDETGVKELVVWGGLVANCAEHSLSELIDRQQSILTSVTYCPSWTKGGVLVRPKYWLGNRCGTAVFPNLADLAIRLEPSILPREYGWVMPGLRRLRLLHITQSIPQEESGEAVEAYLPNPAALQHWLDTTSPSSYSRRVLESSPCLESITIALASTAGRDQESSDWIRLVPPLPVPSAIQRLLLVAVCKPQGSCAMSVLTVNLISNIINFLGSGSWQQYEIKLPASRIDKLGLPEDFGKQALEGFNHELRC